MEDCGRQSSESSENHPESITEYSDASGIASGARQDCGRQSSESCENYPENITENHPETITEYSDETGIASGAQPFIQPVENPDKCIPCAVKLDNELHRASHLRGHEHAIMKLVTGVNYFIPDDSGFPQLYYCVLCNVSYLNYILYDCHLKDTLHKEMALFMRSTSFCKETITVGAGCKMFPFKTEELLNFKNSLRPLYCSLCDKQCNGPKNLEAHATGHAHQKYEMLARHCKFCNIFFVANTFYEYHLRTDFHRRVKAFMSKMTISENDRAMTPKKTLAYVGAEAKPRPVLYFCKLCCIEFHDVDSFRKHRSIAIHNRVEELIRELSVKIDYDSDDDVPSHRSGIDYEPQTDYCGICNIWCSRDALSYDDHVRSVEHLSRQAEDKIRNWDCSPVK